MLNAANASTGTPGTRISSAPLFVNRNEQINQFREAVARGEYLEFSGMAGQGKTEFLNWICYYNAARDYLPIYLGLSDSAYKRPEVFPLLKTIADALSPNFATDNFFASFYQAYYLYSDLFKKYDDAGNDEKSTFYKNLLAAETTMLEAFNEAIEHVLKAGQKVVLCVDNTEEIRASEYAALPSITTAWKVFEKQVIKRHLSHKNFILITAGQTNLAWETLAIRKRIKPIELPLFDEQSLADQITSLAKTKGFAVDDFKPIIPEIRRLTKGHPFSNYKLIDFWTGNDGKFQKALKVTTVKNEEQFKGGIQKLVDEIVVDRFLEDVKLGEAYPPTLEILKYLSLMRYFVLEKLHYMLSTFLSNFFEGKPYHYFEGLFPELLKTGNVLKWRLGLGYEVNPVMRSILMEHMRTNERALFINVQEELVRQYGFWIARAHGPEQINACIEKLYHKAVYLTIKNKEKIAETLGEDLQQHIKRYIVARTLEALERRSQLDTLKNEIKHDAELGDLVDTSKLIEVIEHAGQEMEK